jgi:hypothetical protein
MIMKTFQGQDEKSMDSKRILSMSLKMMFIEIKVGCIMRPTLQAQPVEEKDKI